MLKNTIALLWLIALTACVSAPDTAPSDYPFDVREYFQGRINGYGIIERGERVVSRFDMIVEATSDEDSVVLDESFVFDDGSEFRRVWRLQRAAPGVYVGSADNVDGETTIEVVQGVVRMNYVAAFPNGDDMIRLRFNQRLIPMAGDTVLNLSELSKFGVPVGTVTVIFTPDDLKG